METWILTRANHRTHYIERKRPKHFLKWWPEREFESPEPTFEVIAGAKYRAEVTRGRLLVRSCGFLMHWRLDCQCSDLRRQAVNFVISKQLILLYLFTVNGRGSRHPGWHRVRMFFGPGIPIHPSWHLLKASNVEKKKVTAIVEEGSNIKPTYK